MKKNKLLTSFIAIALLLTATGCSGQGIDEIIDDSLEENSDSLETSDTTSEGNSGDNTGSGNDSESNSDNNSETNEPDPNLDDVKKILESTIQYESADELNFEAYYLESSSDEQTNIYYMSEDENCYAYGYFTSEDSNGLTENFLEKEVKYTHYTYIDEWEEAYLKTEEYDYKYTTPIVDANFTEPFSAALTLFDEDGNLIDNLDYQFSSTRTSYTLEINLIESSGTAYTYTYVTNTSYKLTSVAFEEKNEEEGNRYINYKKVNFSDIEKLMDYDPYLWVIKPSVDVDSLCQTIHDFPSYSLQLKLDVEFSSTVITYQDYIDKNYNLGTLQNTCSTYETILFNLEYCEEAIKIDEYIKVEGLDSNYIWQEGYLIVDYTENGYNCNIRFKHTESGYDAYQVESGSWRLYYLSMFDEGESYAISSSSLSLASKHGQWREYDYYDFDDYYDQTSYSPNSMIWLDMLGGGLINSLFGIDFTFLEFYYAYYTETSQQLIMRFMYFDFAYFDEVLTPESNYYYTTIELDQILYNMGRVDFEETINDALSSNNLDSLLND